MAKAVNEVELRWRQRLHPTYAIAVSGFIGVLLWVVVGRGQFQPVHKATMASAAMLLGYSLLVQVVNATRLAVAKGTLVVQHGPLPWRGPMRVRLEQVRTLRCDPSSRRLVLSTALGEEHVLADDLPAAALAGIDRQIRERLGIGAAPRTAKEPAAESETAKQ